MSKTDANPEPTVGPGPFDGQHELMDSLATIISTLELIPLVAIFGSAILNFWLLTNCQLLHRNLRVILLAQNCAISLYAFLRAFLVIYRKINSMECTIQLIWDLLMAMILFGNSICHILIIERTMASFFVRTYEHWQRPWFSIAWISVLSSVVLLGCLIPSYNVTNFIDPSASFIGATVILTHITLVFSILELITFFGLNLYNKRKFEEFNEMQPPQCKYKLSERYQLSENLKCHRQLAPSFLFHFLNILCSNIVCLLLNYRLVSRLDVANFSMALIFLTQASAKLGIQITVITFHPKLKRDLCRLLMRIVMVVGCERRFTGRVGMDPIELKLRRKDEKSREHDTQEHFKQLNLYWNSHSN